MKLINRKEFLQMPKGTVFAKKEIMTPHTFLVQVLVRTFDDDFMSVDMTIPEAIDFVKKGFKSTIAENKDYDAEGLVLKTPDGLLLRNGERIITKLKTCDFQKYKAKYGDGPAEQRVNPKLGK